MDAWTTPDELVAARLRFQERMPGYRVHAAYGVGLATVSPGGVVLDTRYPQVNTSEHKLPAAVLATVCGYRASTGTFPLTPEQLSEAVEALAPAEACREFDHPNLRSWRDLLVAARRQPPGGGTRTLVAAFVADLEDPLVDSHDAYLRLHLLSHRLVQPHGTNLDGIFSVLPTVVWTDQGSFSVEEFPSQSLTMELDGRRPIVLGIDKFPRMTDYVVPKGVRIADASRVRLGAHLAEGTVVMHEGFCNFNAGTLGPAMIEGRISAGVVVSPGSDLGGGSSVMGTLSGGGRETIVVGRDCLVGANGGIGISLGDRCTVEAGLYVTAGSLVRLPDGTTVKARELSGRPNLLYRRNSITGAIEVIQKEGPSVELNPALHS